MTKSQTEMLEMLAELIDDYSDFQRSRPDLPPGSLCDLSQDELELLVSALQLHKLEQEVAGQIEGPRVFIDRRVREQEKPRCCSLRKASLSAIS
jgi:hypothetical protein